jgi:hypothetical protein
VVAKEMNGEVDLEAGVWRIPKLPNP